MTIVSMIVDDNRNLVVAQHMPSLPGIECRLVGDKQGNGRDKMDDHPITDMKH